MGGPGGDADHPGVLEWGVRRRWLVLTTATCLSWAAAWLGALAAFGALDRAVSVAYFILMPFLFTVVAVWGRRLRLTEAGVEYVGGLSRLSFGWTDVEALDRRHLTYAVARETTTDTGLQISMDSLVRSTPRRQRRIALRPFLDDVGHRTLAGRLAQHRPDLVAHPPS